VACLRLKLALITQLVSPGFVVLLRLILPEYFRGNDFFFIYEEKNTFALFI
jgi:hypothetical protein